MNVRIQNSGDFMRYVYLLTHVCTCLLFLPALVRLQVCVNDVSQGQAEQTEGSLNDDPAQKISSSMCCRDDSHKLNWFYRVIIKTIQSLTC